MLTAIFPFGPTKMHWSSLMAFAIVVIVVGVFFTYVSGVHSKESAAAGSGVRTS
jgi:hypothetical protein